MDPCCEPSSECRLVLGGFTCLLDGGINLGTMGLLVGLIYLRCLCTFFNMRFLTTNVVI